MSIINASWEWDGFGKITATSGARVIALVGKELDGFQIGLGRTEKDACARLITAAPDLRNELEALVEQVRNFRFRHLDELTEDDLSLLDTEPAEKALRLAQNT